MTTKILILLALLIFFIFLSYVLLRKHIRPYRARTWALTEAFWYVISFAALCAGLAELARIEQLNDYKLREKKLQDEYQSKKSLLYAQAWILRLDRQQPIAEREGALWFHRMRSIFDEGLQSSRWEGFLVFSRNYMKNGRGQDFEGKALEYGWPLKDSIAPDSLGFREEIAWVQDSLLSFRKRKQEVGMLRPEENTNYKFRYILIVFFLAALGMKFVKIYADYLRNKTP
jgi:hypothetical protein